MLTVGTGMIGAHLGAQFERKSLTRVFEAAQITGAAAGMIAVFLD